jgi:hypothetical protein
VKGIAVIGAKSISRHFKKELAHRFAALAAVNIQFVEIFES